MHHEFILGITDDNPMKYPMVMLTIGPRTLVIMGLCFRNYHDENRTGADTKAMVPSVCLREQIFGPQYLCTTARSHYQRDYWPTIM